MRLEQWRLVSPIVAAVVLVASILFLALQLRQNNVILQRAAMEDFHNMQNNVADAVIHSRDFAKFHLDSGKQYEALDNIDKYRAFELARKNLRLTARAVNEKFHGHVNDDDRKGANARVAIFIRRKTCDTPGTGFDRSIQSRFVNT